MKKVREITYMILGIFLTIGTILIAFPIIIVLFFFSGIKRVLKKEKKKHGRDIKYNQFEKVLRE